MSHSELPVVVVGRGIAGLAAALSARQRGRDVLVLSWSSGASSMMSGALDDLPSSQFTLEDGPNSKDVEAFLAAFPLFCFEGPTRLLTAHGITRSACGRDRSLLNVAGMKNLKIALPRVPRQYWDADLLARSFNSDPWARTNELSFHAVELSTLSAPALLNYPDSDLATEFDSDAFFSNFCASMASLSSDFGAVLLGPWLGISKPRRDELTGAMNRPVGECTSLVGGTAGLRFEHHSSAVLAKHGIQTRRFRLRSVQVASSSITLHSDSADDTITASSAILATGALISGAIAYCSPEWDAAAEIPERAHPPLRTAFDCPGELRFDGQPVRVPGSLYGLNLEDLSWPSAQQLWKLDHAGLRNDQGRVIARDGNVVPRLFTCGEAGEGSAHSAIDAIRTGWRAGNLAP